MTPPDLVLYHGRVLTLDGAGRVAEAVAVSGDRIVAVGTSRDLLALAGPATRRVDLGGRTVVPGLVDAHAHLDREGLKAVCPSLAGARSIDDVLQTIEALVKRAAPGEWIVTMPLGEPPSYFDVPNNLKEKRFPTRGDLDRVAPRNPVYIRAIWGYWRHTLPLVSVANSEALRLAGVTRETLPPWGGVQIDKEWVTGEPTGIFVEWTYVPLVELSLMAAAPRFTHADRVRALGESMRRYNACGTTSTYEGHGIADEVRTAYEEVHRAGGLTVRPHLVLSPSWGAGDAPALAERLERFAPRVAGRGTGDGWLRLSGLYAEANPTADNAVRARAMPYTGWAGFAYDAALPRETLAGVLLEAARRDIRVASYSKDLLPLYEQVNREVPIRDRRWVIGHLSVLTPDEIGRLRDLGVVCSTHTNRYLHKEGEILRGRLGAAQEDTIVPLRRLKDAGVHVALATDNVPVSLFHPIWHCVARVDRYSGRAVAPAQKLTREEALRACTTEGAWLTFDEDRKGSLEPGKLADLAVLSDDPLTVAEERLPGITAVLTVVGGLVVYEHGDP
ncbi:MAG: amidohydrolase [Candidatus Rokubacteria bacterium]|nr:amidohydrolase [Candidatus Rokubacteria bacterium]